MHLVSPGIAQWLVHWLAAIGTIMISGVASWRTVRNRMMLMQAKFNVACFPEDYRTVLNR
jgi:hypothetical protein